MRTVFRKNKNGRPNLKYYYKNTDSLTYSEPMPYVNMYTSQKILSKIESTLKNNTLINKEKLFYVLILSVFV